MKTRKCKDCGEIKPHEEFHKNTSYKDNIRPYCIPCRRIRELKSYYKNKHKNPYDYEKDKDIKLKKAYGISFQEYKEMLHAQNGMCAICGTTDTGKRKAFAVDHCHTCGEIRGLLCGSCNTAIGLLKENLETMQKAIDYVRFHQEK
jgi:hypothetical protein